MSMEKLIEALKEVSKKKSAPVKERKYVPLRDRNGDIIKKRKYR